MNKFKIINATLWVICVLELGVIGYNFYKPDYQKVRYSFDSSLIGSFENKISYDKLDEKNVVNLFINGLSRGLLLNANDVKKFDVLDVQLISTDEFRGLYKYSVYGTFNCAGKNAECVRVFNPVKVDDERYSYTQEFTIIKKNDTYSFNEFEGVLEMNLTSVDDSSFIGSFDSEADTFSETVSNE